VVEAHDGARTMRRLTYVIAKTLDP
jgi:hypothetical protein